MDFNLQLLLTGQVHDWLLAGLWLSLQLLLVSWVLALPLAVLVAVSRLSSQPVVRALGWTYVEAIRNVPLLAHMLFWYFAAPEMLPEAAREWLYGQHFEAIAAVLALSTYSAAYMSEDVRSGMRAVPAVQMEAARALGMGWWDSLRCVVLPQAFRVMVPPLLSQTLHLWKNTSVATVIGAAELMYQAAKVETETFRSLEPFVFATACYLLVSLCITAVAEWFGRRYPVRAL